MLFYMVYLKIHIENEKRKFSCIAIKFITLVRFYDYYSLWKHKRAYWFETRKCFSQQKIAALFLPFLYLLQLLHMVKLFVRYESSTTTFVFLNFLTGTNPNVYSEMKTQKIIISLEWIIVKSKMDLNSILYLQTHAHTNKFKT